MDRWRNRRKFLIGSNIAHKNFPCVLFSTYKQRIRKEDAAMLKKLFSRKNPYTTAIRKDIADIKAMSRDYEETRKQVLKNVETINALMGRWKHGRKWDHDKQKI